MKKEGRLLLGIAILLAFTLSWIVIKEVIPLYRNMYYTSKAEVEEGMPKEGVVLVSDPFGGKSEWYFKFREEFDYAFSALMMRKPLNVKGFRYEIRVEETEIQLIGIFVNERLVPIWAIRRDEGDLENPAIIRQKAISGALYLYQHLVEAERYRLKMNLRGAKNHWLQKSVVFSSFKFIYNSYLSI